MRRRVIVWFEVPSYTTSEDLASDVFCALDALVSTDSGEAARLGTVESVQCGQWVRDKQIVSR